MALIAFLVSAALFVVPLWVLLPRAGMAPQWALAGAIPLGAIVLLWIIAFRRWPGDISGRF